MNLKNTPSHLRCSQSAVGPVSGALPVHTDCATVRELREVPSGNQVLISNLSR
jgi:hypothetical protein